MHELWCMYMAAPHRLDVMISDPCPQPLPPLPLPAAVAQRTRASLQARLVCGQTAWPNSQTAVCSLFCFPTQGVVEYVAANPDKFSAENIADVVSRCRELCGPALRAYSCSACAAARASGWLLACRQNHMLPPQHPTPNPWHRCTPSLAAASATPTSSLWWRRRRARCSRRRTPTADT